MDALSSFAVQVAVMLLMLAGMAAGDYFASLLFGGVRGRLRRLACTLLFVVFLAVGSRIPEFFGLEELGLYQTALFYGIWGLSSVFAGRFILRSAEFAAEHAPRPWQRRVRLPAADARVLFGSLREGGLSGREVRTVLAAASGCNRTASRMVRSAESGRLKGSVELNPCRLAAAVHRAGFSPKDAVGVLVASFGMSPEKAATVWERSV
jgi:hypothetical protein